MRLILRLSLVALLAMPIASLRAAESWTVSSPDGALAFELRLDQSGALSYRVRLGPAGPTRIDVLGWSPLGLTRDDQAFVTGLKLTSRGSVRTVDDTYTMTHGKRSTIRHRGQEVTFSFSNAVGAPLDVIVRVADDGAAFRYRFPNTDMTPRRVTGETTGFAVPAGAQGFIAPRSPAGKYTPAYEDLYINRPVGTPSPLAGGWDIPALFSIAEGRAWALVTESGVDDHFAASHLAGQAPSGLYRVRLPDAAEGQGIGRAEPASPLPWALPWRVIIVGTHPARIFESTLVDDLAPPSTMRDTSWIKPGRASWSWWSDDDSPKSEATLNRFTDFGQSMGWEYSLVDANWNLMDPAALARVRAHAKEKGVGLLLWYNSGGPHNVVTEQPRDRMHERDVRRKEFATLREWGVKGVKVDFWQSDKQDRMQQYLDLLRDAADFQLMVDFHGCTLPRGWERTFPHLMSMEAVPGAEQYKFNEKYPAAAAWHNTVLAFTRNVVGSMDYTPVTFSDSKYPHLTTYGHELALSVVFESGLQHFADSVKAYESLPAARDFLAMVPAAWDESKLLAGEPGKLVVVARRKGADWYLGGISGTDTPQTVTLDLSTLGRPIERISNITDGTAPRELVVGGWVMGTSGDRKVTVNLLPRGGFVARVNR